MTLSEEEVLGWLEARYAATTERGQGVNERSVYSPAARSDLSEIADFLGQDAQRAHSFVA